MNNVTQWMVDQLVAPEVQAQIIERHEGIPMDNVRLAWPFKTEEELKLLSQWYKQEEKKLKKKQIIEHIKKHGEAFL